MVFSNNLLLGAVSAAASGYLLEQSLLFNGSTTYLNRTPSTAGNRKTWTFSVWVKGWQIGSTTTILSAGTDGTTNNALLINIAAAGGVNVVNKVGGTVDFNYTTNALFRDPSAWLHIVVAVDTTTSSINIYVNGVDMSLGVSTAMTANADLLLNSTDIHYSGEANYGGFGTYTWDGPMALPILVDGAALDPTSFGEEDDDGYWNPIDFTGADTQSPLDLSGLSYFGDMTGQAGLSAAFDGDTTKTRAQSASDTTTTTDSYVGVDHGVGNTETVTGFFAYGTSNFGFGNQASFTISLYGSNALPASETDGTLLYSTGSFANSNSIIVGANSGITSGAYRYHWARIQPVSGDTT